MLKSILFLSALTCATANAAITITLSEVSDNGKNGVMFEFSGSMNITGLAKYPTPIVLKSSMDLSKAQIGSAHPRFQDSDFADGYYVTFDGPGSLGSGGKFAGVFESGSTFGINGMGLIVVSEGYQSGSFIEGKSFFEDVTLADMGFAAGERFLWLWNAGPNADSVELKIVPEPSTVALVSASAAALLALGLRRRRNSSKA